MSEIKKIFTIDLDSKQERYLAEGITPNWSENGKWIAFANKTASYTNSDGTFVYGIPTPDSSLYFYDLEYNLIYTVTVSNYSTMTHHYQKEYISFFEPEWAESDSTILFASEMGIWKIRRWGGEAVRYSQDFDALYYLNKPLDITWSLQPSWSRVNRLLAYLDYTILDFSGNIVRKIRMVFIKKVFGGAVIDGLYSHPSWSPSGDKLVCYYNSSVWIYNVKDLVSKVLDGIP